MAQARRQDIERLALNALAEADTAGNAATRGSAPRKENNGAGKSDALRSLVAPVVRVAPENDITGEVRRLLEGERTAMVLLPFRVATRNGATSYPWLRKALRKPLPCDVAWARPGDFGFWTLDFGSAGKIQNPKSKIQNPSILLPARGGPQAEMSLELAQDLMDAVGAEVSVLHVVQDLPEKARAAEEAPFTEFLSGIAGSGAPDVSLRTATMESDPVQTVSSAANEYDLLIMGAGDQPSAGVGRFTGRVAKQAKSAMIAVKTRIPVGPAIRAARQRARPHVLDADTLSLLVDKWFAENTFHADEFSDLGRLVDIKRKSGLTISLGLPALNEEKTIGEIISVLKRRLMDDVPLLDEIVLMDSNSTDSTREIAVEMGIPVYIHQQVLPEAGPPVDGKGEALWKSLHVLKGDIIAWVDTDVANMHPQFVYGLLGPLLREPRIGYVKGYYHRPIQTGDDFQHEGGGRVTELTVRPLLNLFFPLLSGLVQPLAGEYAGRREVLEQLPFFSGYGVETGLLIDLLEQYGLAAIGQVNLEKRVHRNRSLSDLSLTAFAIVQVILTRLEERARIELLEEVNRSMKLIRFERDHLSLVVRHVGDVERPPIATIPAYRAAHPAK
jgi:glucosyl-3-phosphoglycerate synthase